MPLINFPPFSLDLHSFLTRVTYSAIIIISSSSSSSSISISISIIIIIIFILTIITIRTSNNLDSRASWLIFVLWRWMIFAVKLFSGFLSQFFLYLISIFSFFFDLASELRKLPVKS